MDKKAIEEIMENESLLERFVEVLIEEINNDDEAYYKKGRQLLDLCLTDEKADDFLLLFADGVWIVSWKNYNKRRKFRNSEFSFYRDRLI